MRKISSIIIMLFLLGVNNSIPQSKILEGNWTLVGEVLGQLSEEDKNRTIKEIAEDRFHAYIYYAEPPEICFVSDRRGYYLEGGVVYPFSCKSFGDSIAMDILNGRSARYSCVFPNRNDEFYRNMLLVEKVGKNKYSINLYRKSVIEPVRLADGQFEEKVRSNIACDIENLCNQVKEKLNEGDNLLKGAMMINDTLFVESGLLSDDFWGCFGEINCYYVLGGVMQKEDKQFVRLYRLAFRNYYNKEVGFLSKSVLQLF